MEILKELLKENEAIYEVTCCASKSTYIIGPVVEDLINESSFVFVFVYVVCRKNTNG